MAIRNIASRQALITQNKSAQTSSTNTSKAGTCSQHQAQLPQLNTIDTNLVMTLLRALGLMPSRPTAQSMVQGGQNLPSSVANRNIQAEKSRTEAEKYNFSPKERKAEAEFNVTISLKGPFLPFKSSLIS